MENLRYLWLLGIPFLVFLAWPVKIAVSFSTGEGLGKLKVGIGPFSLRLAGIRRLIAFVSRVRLPVPKGDSTYFTNLARSWKNPDVWLQWFALLRKLFRVNRPLLGSIRARELRWVTVLGFSDPALTGIAAGGLWGLKYLFFSQVNRNIKIEFDFPELKVEPRFTEQIFEIDFQCIFLLRPGQVIIGFLRTTGVLFKELVWKRGRIRVGPPY